MIINLFYFKYYIIIYYITYPSYREELDKYLILNDTNFYSSLTKEKSSFILLGLRLGLGL